MHFKLAPGLEQNAAFASLHAKQRRDRDADELIGLCRGVLLDGAVDLAEARFLLDWIERRADVRDVFPFDVLLRRLADALRDGVLDESEETDLLQAIVGLVGGEARGEQSASLSATLPLCDPAPEVVHAGALIVVTGTFVFGPRKDVVAAMMARGAKVSAAISRRVRYLVIGEVGSRDWVHSSFGRKIEEAADLRAAGVPIHLVSESRWAEFL
jgi:NAD-dependent DNA ligase